MSQPDLSRQRAFRRGLGAEGCTALMLRLKFYRILARRFRCRGGEVDIIARRGSIIAVVEVKARPSEQAGLDAVTAQAWRRIETAADRFLASRPDLSRCSVRYDVVICRPGRLPLHRMGVWQPDR